MRTSTSLGAIVALILLTGCGSGGLGDLGGILGGGGDTSSSASELRGTVDSVDTSSRSILLTGVSNYNSNLADGGSGSGSTARVYYDDQTTVAYQGQNYQPEDLERGDQVSARVEQSGNRLIASSMTVLYNSNTGTGSASGTSTVRGTVTRIDTSRRTIEVDRGTSSNRYATVQYDSNTFVDYDGRRYAVADLERGDQIEIQARDLGTSGLLAQGIYVTRSAGGTGTGTATQTSVRGTVRNVDTSRRTIELEQASWVQRFQSGGSTVVLGYDANTYVDYQGQNHPPTNLERGDVIEVEVRDLGNTYLAQRILLIRDVNTR